MSQNRRRHVRAPSNATALLFSGDQHLGGHAVLNLSAGGVLLAGRPPAIDPEGKLTIILELPMRRPLRAEAALVRTRPATDEPAFALRFTRISASGEDVLQEVVLQTLRDAHAAQALIVAQPSGIELLVERELHKLGRRAFQVTSAGEAIRFFELSTAVTMALVDASIAANHAETFFGFLALRRPHVLRVAMGTPVPSSLAEETIATPPARGQLAHLLQLRPRRRATPPLGEGPGAIN